MMDEVWSRQWVEAREAARLARETRDAEAARTGKPAPTLWGDFRALVRDLIHPPHLQQAEEKTCEAKTCQSAA